MNVKLPVAETLLNDMLLTDVGVIAVTFKKLVNDPEEVLEMEVSVFVAALPVKLVFDNDVVRGFELEVDIELVTPELRDAVSVSGTLVLGAEDPGRLPVTGPFASEVRIVSLGDIVSVNTPEDTVIAVIVAEVEFVIGGAPWRKQSAFHSSVLCVFQKLSMLYMT